VSPSTQSMTNHEDLLGTVGPRLRRILFRQLHENSQLDTHTVRRVICLAGVGTFIGALGNCVAGVGSCIAGMGRCISAHGSCVAGCGSRIGAHSSSVAGLGSCIGALGSCAVELNSCIGALGTCTLGPLPKAPWACKMH